MKETLTLKKVQLSIVAVAMAAIVALGMGAFSGTAYANDANSGLPVGKSTTITKNGVKYTIKNVTKGDGVTLTGVKTTKTSVSVPKTLKFKGYTHTIKAVAKGAFKNAKKAKKITLPASIIQIKAKAFSGSKATKLVLKTKSLTKAKVKNSLKTSKIKTVQAPAAKVKTYKKIFAKANSGKKVTVKK